jgi:hypothetical protein
MLNKEAQKKLLKSLKFSDEDIAKYVDDEKELDIEVPTTIKVLADTEIEELKTNVKDAYKSSYTEIQARQLNKDHELGLSGDDARDLNKVYAAMQAKAVKAAKIPSDDRVKELEASLKKLQDEVIPQYKTEAETWQGKYKEREIFDKYATVIPENSNKFLTKDEHINRVKREVSLGENGEAINPATGQPYRDGLEKAIPFADKVAELYKTKEGWLDPTGGAKGATFHHSTQGGQGGNGRPAFDQDKFVTDLKEKYNWADPDQRKAAMAELTVAQVNAAKN